MTKAARLKFAIFGTGFWANYQIPGWQELKGATCVAAYNRTKEKARKIAEKFGVPRVYDDPKDLIRSETDLNFIDICTAVETHLSLTKMAAENGLDVVCQKPMAENLEDAREMLAICRSNGVNLFINENFRWQAPIRALKESIDSGVIGSVFKSRVSFCSAFPVFDNQPFLAELEHFILTDIGSHILDVARYLFGEVSTLHCHTNRVNQKIKGEDVANVLMKMTDGSTCYAEMSYASILEVESFPQMLVLVEGSEGSVKLDHNYQLKITTKEGTRTRTIQPAIYPWIDPEYAVVHSSIVDCQRDILNGLRGGKAETTGADNLKTTELVWKCYESAKSGELVRF